MTDLGSLGSLGAPLIFFVSLLLSALVLAYRWPRTAFVRRVFDDLQRRLTGQPDWRWLRLWHILVPLVIVTAVNLVWIGATVHCAEDSYAILASGEAALHGQNPFVVNYCSQPLSDEIPYGLAEVAINAVGATSGSPVGMYVVWQLLALAVVPLVWAISGEHRRYLSVLVAVSVFYLPNIATNIGVENAIVPVSVLLMMYAILIPRARGTTLLKGLAAFLSTARFPALFPLLGSSAALPRGRWAQALLVLGVFLGSAGLAYLLWGWDAIQVVYLGQFSRVPGESLNVWALLLTEGWVHPSLGTAAIQGIGILALVLFVNWRRYSTRAAVALPLLGVMFFSQYLSFHFVLWLVPLLLLGGSLASWMVLYGAVAYVDETYGLWYFGMQQNLWWPYEFLGCVLAALLIVSLYLIVRDEERRIRSGGPAV